jgi:hypothetical protein
VLLGLLATALLVAGIFTTDPGLGYPVGAAAVHTSHGLVHGLARLAAFTPLPAAAFVMAWHSASGHEQGWSLYSVSVGICVIAFVVAGTVASAMDG